jgi:type IV pilus assembly protein PilM
VIQYLELLRKAGLEVDALDVGPAAWARLIRHAGARGRSDSADPPNVLLLNFAAEASYLTVIWGRRLMLDRTVAFSERNILARVMQVLDAPRELALALLGDPARAAGGDEQAAATISEILRPELATLIAEVNDTLAYLASKTRGCHVDAIFVAGRAAGYPSVLKALGQHLAPPVRRFNPVEIFSPPGAEASTDLALGESPGIILAAGMALRGT